MSTLLRRGDPGYEDARVGRIFNARRQDRFLSEANYRRLAEIRARRDPAGRFASYLTSDRAGLNVHA